MRVSKKSSLQSVHAHASSATSSTTSSTATSQDPVTELQDINERLSVAQPLDKETRKERKSVIRRSTAGQVNVVLAEAERAGGTVGGVAIDAPKSRDDLARAARLRVGALAARQAGQRLSDEAVTLESNVTQVVLGAIFALEGQSLTPDGKALVPKVAAMRAAGKKQRAPSAGAAKKTKGKEVAAAAAAPAPVASTATPKTGA